MLNELILASRLEPNTLVINKTVGFVALQDKGCDMSSMLDCDAKVIRLNTNQYPNFEIIKNWSVPILIYYFEIYSAKGAVIAALLCAKALSMKG